MVIYAKNEYKLLVKQKQRLVQKNNQPKQKFRRKSGDSIQPMNNGAKASPKQKQMFTFMR